MQIIFQVCLLSDFSNVRYNSTSVVLLLGVSTLAMCCCDYESVVVLALSLLCCRFNCGRWFARSDEDGSVERFLVAEKVPQTIVKSCSMSALSMYKCVHVFSSEHVKCVVCCIEGV